jgi:phytoene/squalene synthetase
VRPTLAEAQAWCRHLATTHYENFHVATWFLPKRARRTSRASTPSAGPPTIWAMRLRIARPRLRLLGEWRAMLDECYERAGESMHPVFVALHQTIVETGVPEAALRRSDQRVRDGSDV